MQHRSLSNLHPLTIFWIGVLTGALVVALMFLYRTINSGDYKTSLLKVPTYKTTTTTGLSPTVELSPTATITPTQVNPVDSTMTQGFGRPGGGGGL